MADEIARLYATIGMDATQMEQGAAKANAVLGATTKGIAGLGKEADAAGPKTKAMSLGLNDIGQVAGAINPRLGQMVATIGTFGTVIGPAVAAIGVWGAAFKTAWDLGLAYTQDERVQKGFGLMANEANQSADAVVVAMNKAAKGTIQDEDLMSLASKAWALGLKLDVDQMGQLMEVAKVRSAAMGMSTAEAFSTAAYGISSGMQRTLKTLGVRDIDAQYAAYAASVNKAANELTDAERSQVAFNAVVSASAGILKQSGDAALSNADKVAIAQNAWENLGDAIGRRTAPAVGGISGAIAGAVNLVTRQIAVGGVSTASLMGPEAGLKNAEKQMSTWVSAMGTWKNATEDAKGPAGALMKMFYGVEMAQGQKEIDKLTKLIAVLRAELGLVPAAASAGMSSIMRMALAMAPEMTPGLLAMQNMGRGGTNIPMGSRSVAGDYALLPGLTADERAKSVVDERIRQYDAEIDASKKFVSAMDTTAASMAARISGYFSDAQTALKGLLPGFGFGGDITKPGANGPFENIYRAAAVAQGGNQNEWASKLSIDQNQAKKIVQDFGAGNMTADVMKLVDVSALVAAAQQAEAAKASQVALAQSIADQAGVSVGAAYKAIGIANPAAEGAQAKTDFAAGFKGVGDSIITQMQADLKAKAADIEAAGTSFILTYAKGFSSNKGALTDFANAIVGAVLKAMKDEGR